MTYDAMEQSVQDAQRIEIYTFELPDATYRLTSYDEDVTFDSNAYEAAPIGRGPAPLATIGGGVREMTVSIAVDHDLAVALRRGGVPPQNALVTIKRFHAGDAEARAVWIGYIGGTSTDREFMRIRVPNKIDLAFDCQLPAKLAERRCSHFLGDEGCGVDLVAGGFRITPTVSSVSGTTVVVSSISSKPDHWARDGKIVRTSDGEKRTIIEQVGTTLTLDFPFRDLANGDALEVYAGCDHSLLQDNGCDVKFSNSINFGGEPEMPTSNPSAPLGLGIAIQV